MMKKEDGIIIEKEILSKLKQSEEKFRSIFNNSNDSIFIHTLNGKILEVNDSACKKLGYSKKELLLLSPQKVDSQRFAKNIPRKIKEVLKNGSSIFETAHVTKSGKEIPIEVNAILIEFGGQKAILSICRDITERKKSEDLILESEKRFKSYFNLPLVGIAITSPHKNWIKVNDALCSMLGYTHEELIKKTWAEITYPEDLHPDLERFNKILSGKIDSYSMDKRFIRKDGKIIWTSLSLRSVRKPDGKVDYFVALLQDIDERKKVERELKIKNMIFNLSESSNSIADLNGIILDVNPAFLKIVGFSKRGDVIGRHVSYFFKDPQNEKEVLSSLKKFGRWSGEINVKRKDGKKVVVFGSCTYLFDDAGKAIGFQSSMQDITERKKAEEELKKSKENVDKLVVERTSELQKQTGFLSSVLENVPDMIFVKDAKELRFELFNKAGEDLLGQNREKFYGKNDYDFFPKKQADFFTEKDRAVLKNKRLVDIPREPIKTKSGERILHTKKIPILDNDGKPKYLLGISEDITDRIKAMEELISKDILLDQTGEIARVGGWTIDVPTMNLQWTKETYEIHELNENTFVPTVEKAIHFYDPQSIPLITRAVNDAIKHGKSFDLKLGIITAKGKHRDVRAKGIVKFEAGQVKNVFGVFLDITEQKKHEDELTQRNIELEKFNKIAVGRELKMVELKNKIEALEDQLKQLKENNRQIK